MGRMEPIQRDDLVLKIIFLTKAHPPNAIFVLNIIPLFGWQWFVPCFLPLKIQLHGSGRQKIHLYISIQYLYHLLGFVKQMEHKQKLLQFYSTGRYECDYDFHIYLQQIIKQLNLHQWQARLDDMAQHVKKIRDLTLLNSKHSDQDYEDDEVISQTYKIKSLVTNINTKDIHAIIKECQELNWESYYVKIQRAMVGKTNYSNILQRIQKTIHSQQFRIDSMLFTTLFQMVNGQGVNKHIEVYCSVVQIFLKYLTGCKADVDIISESSVYSNICQLAKVKHFVCSIYLILRVCLRFCQIVKVLAGKNNLSLKFTVIKKELEKLIKKHPQWIIIDQKDDLFAILPIIKSYLKNKTVFDKSKICKWCFKVLNNEKNEHEFCRILIQKRNTFVKS